MNWYVYLWLELYKTELKTTNFEYSVLINNYKFTEMAAEIYSSAILLELFFANLYIWPQRGTTSKIYTF